MRFLITCVPLLAAVLVLLGFFGAWHPALDTLALGRPIFGAICLLGLLMRTRWVRLVSGAAVLSTVTLGSHLMAYEPASGLRLYSKNLFFRTTNMEPIIADIRDAGVDLVMLQELSFHNEQILHALRSDFPHQHRCQFSRWSGLAVLSRYPLSDGHLCSERRAISAVQVQLPDRTVWAASVHIPWPWPHDASRAEAAARKVLAQMDGPIVVAGDFNSMPWTARIGQIARKTKTKLAGPMRHTYTLMHTPISIDHVLAPGGGTVERRPMLGSDHAGLVAQVDLEG